MVLRQLDRPEEALALIGERPGQPAETELLRAHLLGDSGRLDEAAESYRALIRQRPQLLDAHETLARLLPQVGAADEALDAYREAIAREPTIDLYRSAIIAARDLKNAGVMLGWTKEALARFGRQADLVALHGLALGLGGDSEGALAELEPLAETGFAPVLAHCAYYRLKLGDLGAAEAHAVAATAANPLEQTAWAYLTVIWRLLDDPREKWLADYERLVIPLDISAPAGFANIGAFMDALAGDLSELHATRHHPLEQSLREGTQTRGLLFGRQIPTVQALVRQLDRQVGQALSHLPVDSGPSLPRPQHRRHPLRRLVVGPAEVGRFPHQPYPPYGLDELGALRVAAAGSRQCIASGRRRLAGLRRARPGPRPRLAAPPDRDAARRAPRDLPVLFLARDDPVRQRTATIDRRFRRSSGVS